MKETMKWTETVRLLFSDDDGEWKPGLTNGVTVDSALHQLGIDAVPVDREYRTMQITLNTFCKQRCKEGLVAGGIGRSPTVYFIAANPSEKWLIALSRARGLVGRMQMAHLRGQGLYDTRTLVGAANLLMKQMDKSQEESASGQLKLLAN